MILVMKKKVASTQLKQMAEDYDGYIKLVVDLEREILAGGGEKHVDGEQALLADGSKQQHLWGGGIDLETKEVDYNSIINLRPNQANPSRDILDAETRKN